MGTEAGVWIDHRKAVVAIIAGQSEEMKHVESNVEKHTRYSGGPEHSAEDQRDRRFTGHLNKYYDEVIECIRGAESILILGPGEAKLELKERLSHAALAERVVAVEAADKMTDGQIAALVRKRFAQ